MNNGINRMLVIITLIMLAIIGGVWCAVSTDWPTVTVECNEDEDEDCEPSVKTGSRGHSRGYSHGGKY